MSILDSISCSEHHGAIAAGSSDVEPSAGVDCAQFDGVLFVAAIGAMSSGAVLSLRAEASSDNGDQDAYSAISGAEYTVEESSANTVVYLDVAAPPARYVRCVVRRATANSALRTVVAQRYGAQHAPSTQEATISGGLRSRAGTR